MPSQSISTRSFPLIFAAACLLFGMLFIFFYTFVFNSIDQIFSQKNTSKLSSITQTTQETEKEFRNTAKILYLNRSVQKAFAKIALSGASEEILLDLQNKLQVWHEKQGPDVYSAAMYMDRAGMPLIALDFNATAARSDGDDLLSTLNNGPSKPSIILDPSVTSTWSANMLQANRTYAVHHVDGTYSLRSIYPVLDRKTKEANGFLSIDRTLHWLLQWNVKKEETLLIIDVATQQLVFDSSSAENATQPLDSTYPYLIDAEYMQDETEIPPYAKAEGEHGELLVIRETLPEIGWQLFHIAQLNPYISRPQARGRLLVAGALVFLIVTGGAIYTLTKRVQSRSQQLEEANAIVSQHNQLLEQELQTAHDMQMRLMPQKNPQLDGYEVVGRCRPATEVGGDFFQYFNVDDKKWIFTLADVTGHGMQAAVPTMVFSGLLDTEISYSSEPETLMPKLNHRLCRVLEPRTFVCLSLGELDCTKNTMRISNGGCPYPYFYKASDQSVDELNLSAFPLGVRDGSTYEVLEVPLDSGDV
ncbi:MAG: SpoIIE family protein phosphatase, partial [Candidatus Latescibacterota bacterium]|nr:SpoIIE family protein phosphatase [Candidatus Latescibacterota bacterium]